MGQGFWGGFPPAALAIPAAVENSMGAFPPAALAIPAAVENSMAAFPPGGTGSPCPGGRGSSQTPPSLATDSSISPGPPSPWLPALFTSAASQPPRHPWAPLTPAEQATQGESPPPGTTAAGSVSAAGGLMPGCRGRSPPRNKILVSPIPTGEGGWGDRGQKQNKKQGWQATKKVSPPSGTTAAG